MIKIEMAMADIWSAIKSAFLEEGHLCRPDCGRCCCAGAYVEAREAETIGESARR